MPQCGNCGAQVTKAYKRVFCPDHCTRVRCCPNCEKTRDGAYVREMRGQTQRSDSTDYDASGRKVIGDD